VKITMAVRMELSVEWHVLGTRGSKKGEREGEGEEGRL
jgi:hypothetical protein